MHGPGLLRGLVSQVQIGENVQRVSAESGAITGWQVVTDPTKGDAGLDSV